MEGCKSLISVDEQFYPDPYCTSSITCNYAIFEHLYEKLKDDFHKN